MQGIREWQLYNRVLRRVLLPTTATGTICIKLALKARFVISVISASDWPRVLVPEGRADPHQDRQDQPEGEVDHQGGEARDVFVSSQSCSPHFPFEVESDSNEFSIPLNNYHSKKALKVILMNILENVVFLITTWEMNTMKKVQIETITKMFVRIKFHFDLKLKIKVN